MTIWVVALASIFTVTKGSAPLPMATKLRVEHLDAQTENELVTISVTQPRFSFIPQINLNERGVNMSAFQVVVRESSGSDVWDSGIVKSSSAISILCGVQLKSLSKFSFTVQWHSNDGRSSPNAVGVFEIGPVSETDWDTSRWIGNGQNEFKINTNVAAGTMNRMRLYIASPGGVIVKMNNSVIGDESGVSAWLDFGITVKYDSFSIPNTFDSSSSIKIYIGNGFYNSPHSCKSGSGHIGGGGFCGPSPVARVLLVAESTHSIVSKIPFIGPLETVHLDSTLTAMISGRNGSVKSDDPWAGTVTDWTLGGEVGWGPAKTASIVPPGALSALAVDHTQVSGSATSSMPSTVDTVTKLKTNKWHYKFSRNIVGQIVVQPGAYKGPGKLVLTFCEIMNGTACSNLRGLAIGTGQDIHMLPALSNTEPLRTYFTWHGFQHVIVEAMDGAVFTGQKDSLAAVWTVANLAESGTISFGGPGSELLSQIRDITKSSQLGNMAGYIPTDCPTREKHGWLGDAQVTAEEAMYNLYSPAVYELFLDVIRSNQNVNKSSPGLGNFPIVVPAALAPKPGDISWTAAYPLIAGWMYQYYGDLNVVRDHWPNLKDYMVGQQREAGASTLPTFWACGDWCAVQPRAICSPGTGPPAAGANYILALKSMITMAKALGYDEDVDNFSKELTGFQAAFDRMFWNTTLGTYSNDPMQSQTLSSLAIAADVIPAARKQSVISALTNDIDNRDDHLTVGSAGQKWLLRTLTDIGYHDTALKLATQTTYPSWGYWISQGATTCWENWSGISDGSHPGTPENPNPPTHNHIFLCGGIGEWMYRSLGGIAPAAPGYSQITVDPKISKTLGPNSVNATLETASGTIKSSWTRHSVVAGVDIQHAKGCVVEVCTEVPVGVSATFSLPLLNISTRGIWVTEGTEVVWNGKSTELSSPSPTANNIDWLLSQPVVSVATDGDSRLALTTGSGHYCFCVHHQQNH